MKIRLLGGPHDGKSLTFKDPPREIYTAEPAWSPTWVPMTEDSTEVIAPRMRRCAYQHLPLSTSHPLGYEIYCYQGDV